MMEVSVTAPRGEDPKTLLKLLVRDLPAWKRVMKQMHEDAGLDEWDDDLIDEALDYLHGEMNDAVYGLGSDFTRHVLVKSWQKKKKAPAHTEA